MQETYANKIYGPPYERRRRAAPSRSPPRRASAPCSTCWPSGRLPQRGFVRQEEIPLSDFLANRFGRVYAPTQRPGAMQVRSVGMSHQRDPATAPVSAPRRYPIAGALTARTPVDGRSLGHLPADTTRPTVEARASAAAVGAFRAWRHVPAPRAANWCGASPTAARPTSRRSASWSRSRPARS